MGVRFYTDNWLTASAGVGLLRVLEKAGVDWKPFVSGNVIEISEEVWEKLFEYYFEYLFHKAEEDLNKEVANGGISLGNAWSMLYKTYNLRDFYGNSQFSNNNSYVSTKINKEKILTHENLKTELLQAVKKAFESILNNERSSKLCFFCRERGAYIKRDKVKTFDATNFTPLGASPETLENLFWNGRGNMYLCPECEIFLYFSAFGFTKTPRGTYLFVYAPDLGTAYDLNNVLAQEGTKSVISRTIVEASKRVEGRKAKWILENIYIVEIEKVGDAQANIYTLNISAKLARAIRGMIDEYPPLFDDLFDPFIEYVYSGRSLYEFLFSILSSFFYSERYKKLSGRKAEVIKKGKALKYLPKNLTFFIKFQEVLNMEEKEKVSKQVNWAYGEGLSLRKTYFNELGEDRAKKKIESISYRILEAIRRRDTDAFEQNLIRAYLEVEREIPYVFVEALKDGSFNRIAYAFLIGLNGKDKEASETEDAGS